MNRITLNDNGSNLFNINSEDEVIETVNETPIRASNFMITATDAEIDSNNTNAVNKRYIVNKISSLDNKFITENQCDAKYETIAAHNSDISTKADKSDTYTKAEVNSLITALQLSEDSIVSYHHLAPVEIVNADTFSYDSATNIVKTVTYTPSSTTYSGPYFDVNFRIYKNQSISGELTLIKRSGNFIAKNVKYIVLGEPKTYTPNSYNIYPTTFEQPDATNQNYFTFEYTKTDAGALYPTIIAIITDPAIDSSTLVTDISATVRVTQIQNVETQATLKNYIKELISDENS